MQKKIVLVLMILLLALAACGGDSSEPAPAPANSEPAAETADTATEEPAPAADVSADTAETTDAEPTEAPAEEAPAEEAPAEEAPAEEAATTGAPVTEGTDADTGLIINPESPAPGDTFLVRGTITSMNLTPQTSPEFLIQAPNGTRYRMSSQALDQTFVEDGSQIRAFEYQIGMWVEATVSLAADAGPSDIYSTNDLTILLYED